MYNKVTVLLLCKDYYTSFLTPCVPDPVCSPCALECKSFTAYLLDIIFQHLNNITMSLSCYKVEE